MVLDGLWCAIGGTHMGLTAENLSEQFGISKELQNEVAYQSQLRATAAIKDGRFKDEIVPVVIPQRKGDPKVVDTDECPRETSPEILAGLKPVFKKDGVVTAGNASAIADGASALVVTSRKKAAELGLKPIAQLVSYATAAVDPSIMGLGETKAAQLALEKAGMTSKDVQLAELNEAFACVAALAIRELGLEQRHRQRQRRCGRSRPSARQHRHAHDRHAHPRAPEARPGDRPHRRLRRRRPGRRLGHQGRGLISPHETTPHDAPGAGAGSRPPAPGRPSGGGRRDEGRQQVRGSQGHRAAGRPAAAGVEDRQHHGDLRQRDPHRRRHAQHRRGQLHPDRGGRGRRRPEDGQAQPRHHRPPRQAP